MRASPRDRMLQQVDPTHRVQHASARAQSVARPQDLLGAPPHTEIAYISQLARSLAGPEAANLQPPLPELRPAGSTFDARA